MEEFRITSGAQLPLQPIATGPKVASLQAVKEQLFPEGPESGLMKRVKDLEAHASGINDLGMGFCNPTVGGHTDANGHATEIQKITDEALAQVECAKEIVAPDGDFPDPMLYEKLDGIRIVLEGLHGAADAVKANSGGILDMSGTSLLTLKDWDNLRNQVQFLVDLKLQ